MDLLLNSEGQLLLKNGMLFVTPSYQTDIAQRIQTRLKTFLGEWFLDTTIGVDWLNAVFGKGRSKNTIDALIRAQIELEENVLSVIGYKSNINTATRAYSATFQVKINDPTTIVTLKLITTETGIVITTESGSPLTT